MYKSKSETAIDLYKSKKLFELNQVIYENKRADQFMDLNKYANEDIPVN